MRAQATHSCSSLDAQTAGELLAAKRGKPCRINEPGIDRTSRQRRARQGVPSAVGVGYQLHSRGGPRWEGIGDWYHHHTSPWRYVTWYRVGGILRTISWPFSYPGDCWPLFPSLALEGQV